MKLDFSLIHKFEIDGTYIVLDINSDLVHVLSREAWDFLNSWEEAGGDTNEVLYKLGEKYPPEELRAIGRQFLDLINGGLLFSRDESLDNFRPQEQNIVKALCLNVAHDCNLRCRYCFAGTGDFGGGRTLMDAETGKRALDFLFTASGKRKHIEVDYFGGEPLMNFTVVKELIKYGKTKAQDLGKVLKQTLTTNAVLLNKDITEYLNKEEISLVLSLDGRPEVHDRMRPFTKGLGSYQHILPRIKALVDSRQDENYYLRGTYTSYNLDFAQDVLHMVDLGYTQVSVEPVVAEPGNDYALQEAHLPLLEEQYRQLARVWLRCREEGRPFNFFHFNISLDKGPCLPKRLSGCGAGHEYLAVSPEGDLYPCHQFVGKENFRMGSVWGGITDHTWGPVFKAAHVLNKETCRACWARFHCSGGCHANAYNFHGDITQPYELGCRLEKARLECALYLQVKSLPSDLEN